MNHNIPYFNPQELAPANLGQWHSLVNNTIFPLGRKIFGLPRVQSILTSLDQLQVDAVAGGGVFHLGRCQFDMDENEFINPFLQTDITADLLGTPEFWKTIPGTDRKEISIPRKHPRAVLCFFEHVSDPPGAFTSVMGIFVWGNKESIVRLQGKGHRFERVRYMNGVNYTKSDERILTKIHWLSEMRDKHVAKTLN